MIIYNLRKPVETGADNSVGVTGENNSFTAKFLIRELVNTKLAFSIHLRFADGSVNSVVPDEVSVDDEGTTIIWNVKNTDIFVHGFFEVQIEGRKSDGYVFQTEIVRMYADESIAVEDKAYENPNAETLKLREEAYDFLCELKLQQDKLEENMKQLLATDITKKQDAEYRVSDMRDVGDEEKSYPSIKYLNGYYYNINETYSSEEVDEKLNNKADKATTLAGYGITDAIKNASGTVSSDNIASGAVTVGKIANNTVLPDNLVSGAVTKDKISASAVTTKKIADGSVTMPKLADDVIAEIGSKAAIYDVNVALVAKANKATTLAGYGITDAIKNENQSIQWYHIADDAINVNKLGNKSVTKEKLSADLLAEFNNKADKTIVVSGCEGVLTFVPYSKFVLGQIGTNGTYNPDIKYRVISEDIMKFDYDLNISVNDGFTAFVVKYSDGSYVSMKSLSDTNGYIIPSGTEFKLHIRRNPENTSETANISEFVNAVKFQTKIASEVAKKADADDINAALASKMDESVIEQGVAPMTIEGHTKDDFYALNCRYQKISDYCYITFTANPKVVIDSPLVFEGLPFVAYNTSILAAYTGKNSPIKIEITNNTSTLTVTKISGEAFSAGETITFSIGHRIKS